MKVTVTSKHPNYPAVYTTLYNGISFDINIESGVVWQSMRPTRNGGFRNAVIEDEKLIGVITEAVNKHINKH